MVPDLPRDRVAALCREYGVIELDVFGSVARGEATEDSDIDFLYVLSDPSIGMRFLESSSGAWPRSSAGTRTTSTSSRSSTSTG